MRPKEMSTILLTSFILAQLRKRRNQRLADIHAQRKGTMYFEASVRTNIDLALLCPSRRSIVLTAPRGLTIQRDELAQSSAVDANALTDKLKYA